MTTSASNSPDDAATTAVVTAIVGSDGHQVEVRESHPPRGGLQLHTLVRQAKYVCTACDQPRKSVTLATEEHPVAAEALVCPGCYERRGGSGTGPHCRRRWLALLHSGSRRARRP